MIAASTSLQTSISLSETTLALQISLHYQILILFLSETWLYSLFYRFLFIGVILSKFLHVLNCIWWQLTMSLSCGVIIQPKKLHELGTCWNWSCKMLIIILVFSILYIAIRSCKVFCFTIGIEKCLFLIILAILLLWFLVSNWSFIVCVIAKWLRIW